MLEYLITFFALFFTDIFYTFYLKSVHEEKKIRASLWAVVVYTIAAIAVIEYNNNHWLLIPAGIGAFCGTYVGMIIRKKE
jgi:O-antigen/teichoic acid export membrane protein